MGITVAGFIVTNWRNNTRTVVPVPDWIDIPSNHIWWQTNDTIGFLNQSTGERVLKAVR
jgi:hypothetical protein